MSCFFLCRSVKIVLVQQRNAISTVVVGGGEAARKTLLALGGDAIAGAVCEPEELRDLIDDSQRFINLEEALERKRPDVVYIATPVCTHVPLACRVLQRGVPVLIEKPLALTLADADGLAGFASRLIAVAFKKRFAAAVQYVRERVASLELERARFDWEIPAPRTPWRYAREQSGGGVLMDLGSHVLDLFEYLFGPMDAVEARMTAVGSAVESSAELRVRFASSAIGDASLAWGSVHRQVFTIEGRRGSIVLNRVAGGADVVTDGGVLQFEQRSEYVTMFRELANAIHGQPSAIPTLADGVRNLQWIEHAYEAPRH